MSKWLVELDGAVGVASAAGAGVGAWFEVAVQRGRLHGVAVQLCVGAGTAGLVRVPVVKSSVCFAGTCTSMQHPRLSWSHAINDVVHLALAPCAQTTCHGSPGLC